MKSTHSSYQNMYVEPTLHCYLFKKSYNPEGTKVFKPHISELCIKFGTYFVFFIVIKLCFKKKHFLYIKHNLLQSTLIDLHFILGYL